MLVNGDMGPFVAKDFESGVRRSIEDAFEDAFVAESAVRGDYGNRCQTAGFALIARSVAETPPANEERDMFRIVLDLVFCQFEPASVVNYRVYRFRTCMSSSFMRFAPRRWAKLFNECWHRMLHNNAHRRQLQSFILRAR